MLQINKILFILIMILINFTNYINSLFEQCDHTVFLTISQPKSYINTPNYPNKYPAGSSCRFQVIAPQNYRIKIECNFYLDKQGSNCDSEKMYLSLDGDKQFRGSDYFCGKGYLDRRSLFNELSLAYVSTSRNNNYAGLFTCLASAEPQPCDCGWAMSSKIFGGTETKINEFPSVVAILYKGTLFCGGSIISSRFILSAAHCAVAKGRYYLEALVGEHDLRTNAESPYTERYQIDDVKIHENYLPNSNDLNDIALFRTSKNIRFSRAVGPICLPFLYSFYLFENVWAEIVGWGTQGFGGPSSSVLLKAATQVTTNAFCKKEFPYLAPQQICSYNPPKDSCQFDSGGPLIYRNGRMFLIGAISFGKPCGSNAASVNTRITSYLQWIMDKTQDSFCRKALGSGR